jgi:arylsulfatase A
MDHLDPSEPTFADVLKAKGYATGLAGKWQLGTAPKQPTMIFDSGFDTYCTWAWIALPANADFPGSPRQRYWHPAVIVDGKHMPTTPDQYGPDVYCNWLIEFVRANRDKPFLAYYPMCLTHKPWDPTPVPGSPGAKTEPGLEPNVEYMDHLVGRIVDALDELGLRDNTIIFFTGDNGTAGAGKGKTTEMGVRVPLIVNCPRIVKPTVSDELIDLSDVLPTLAELAGADPPPGVVLDGRSFAPLLRGKKGDTRDWIFSYLAYERMLRDRRWLLEGDGRLYDCGNRRDGKGYKDVTESNDPDVLAARKRFDAILADLPAPSAPKRRARPHRR